MDFNLNMNNDKLHFNNDIYILHILMGAIAVKSKIMNNKGWQLLELMCIVHC